jgi:hypothetical protein
LSLHNQHIEGCDKAQDQWAQQQNPTQLEFEQVQA